MPDNRSANAVVAGSLAEIKFIKTRSVCVLCIELPIENAEDAISKFGIPLPGQEIPVAVARLLVSPVSAEVPEIDERPAAIVATPRAKRGEYDRLRVPFHTLSRAQQAGIKCSDAEFQEWLFNLDTPHSVIGPGLDRPPAELAAVIVRHHCRVPSRGYFDNDERAGARWDALLARFDEACGRIAERR